MIVKLPSNGILGTKTVDLRQPTFDDIRKSNSFNTEDFLFKSDFVKLLIPTDTNLSKITYWDLEYLFLIAAFAVQFNEVTFKSTCSCGKQIESNYNLLSQEVVDIKPYKLPHVLKLNNKEVRFNILSAQDGIDAAVYAIGNDNYEQAFQDAIVNKVYGYLADAQYSHDLSVAEYLAAFLFHKANFHGVRTVKTVQCPSCQKEFEVEIGVDSSFIHIDLDKIMSMYANVHDVLTFDAFVKLTIPEYKAYIDALNSRLNR